MSRKSKSKHVRPADPASIATPSVTSATPLAPLATPRPAPALSPSRRRLFRILSFTVLPVVVLLLSEAGLRLAGFGYPAAYFVKTDIQGRESWVGNQQFSLRFFPPALARELDRPVVSVSKPAGTIRVFVLGDSAAQGDPEPAFAFSRLLDVMLRARHPSRRFEVINTAITAINSNVILPIARECAQLEPDLFVLYLGNNEVIGPYGPATVFTRAATSLTLMRAAIAAKTTRLGQLMDVLMQREGSAKPPVEWGGMTMFLANRIRADDPRWQAVDDHFRQNLDDIIRAGLGGGAQVIVCTLGVNLKDCPPFCSLSRSDLSASDQQRWQALVDAGAAQVSAGQHDQALVSYTAAAAIDGTHAELRYRLARCHEALAQREPALAEYGRARDLDALPFRATSRLIDLMRSAPSRHGSGAVHLADVARANEADSAQGLPGSALFLEHVHLTFHGNYVAARTVLEQAERALGAVPVGVLPSESDCAVALAFTAWEQRQISEVMLARQQQAPFTDQFNHLTSIANLETALERQRASVQPAELAAAEAQYQAAVSQRPDDWRLHELHGRFLSEGREDSARAVQPFQHVVAAIPFDYHAQLNLGSALSTAKQHDAAEVALQAALRLKPGYSDALCALAALRVEQQRSDDAQLLLMQALAQQPGSARAHAALGRLFEAQGRFDDALSHFSLARQTPAQLGLARNRYAVALAKGGNPAGAIAQFRAAIALHPGYAEAHLNLGSVLAQQGDKDEALRQVSEAVRLNPGFAEAYAQLGGLLFAQRQVDAAIVAFTTALRLKPELALTHNSLGAALAGQGRFAEAIPHFAEAVRLRPDLVNAQKNLEQARARLAAPR